MEDFREGQVAGYLGVQAVRHRESGNKEGRRLKVLSQLEIRSKLKVERNVKSTVKENWQVVVLCAIHAVLLLVLFRSGIYHNASLEHDTSVFFNYSSMVMNGALPYRDFIIEYPPLALLFFILPRLFASTLISFQFAFAVEIFIFDVVGLFLLSRLAKRFNINPILTLAAYTVLIAAIGPIIIYRYDLIPAIMVLAGLYFYTRQMYKLSCALLAAGMLTKIFPAVIVPILLLDLISKRKYRESIQGIAIFSIATMIIVAPALFISPGGFWDSFSLQMHRGLHSESTYASFLLLGQNLGLTTVHIQMTGPIPLSVDAVSSVSGILARIAPAVMVAVLLLVYYLFYRRRCNDSMSLLPDASYTMLDITNYFFISILIFILTNNVFSPQYLIWLIPIAPLVTWRWRHLPWLVIALAGVLTYYYYPLHYNSFMQGDPLMVDILVSRNILLITLAVVLMMWKLPVSVKLRRPVIKLAFKPYIAILAITLMASSVIFIQFTLNTHISPGGITNQIPGGQPGSGPGGLPQNGFPGGPPPGGGAGGPGRGFQ